MPAHSVPPSVDITQQLALASQWPTGEMPESARLVTRSEATPRSFVIEREVVLGRSGDVDMPLRDSGVSREHARIRLGPDRVYFIEDLGSRNGTFVNGTRVQRQQLSFGDRIRLGSQVELSFERTSAEERRLIEQQKMEAIGRLSAGVAHEFHNFLAVMLASIEYLQGLIGSRVPGDPDIVEALDDATSAAQQAQLVTRQLVAFARPGEGRFEDVRVAELLREVVQLARRTFDRRINVELAIDEHLRIRADRGLLFQALMNLCINARDAMPQGGTLRLTARARPRTAMFDGLAIDVSDTGEGFDESVASRLFEPFFTTKAGGHGTGLGLPLVYSIVKSHGGQVDVTSKKGEGTTFSVWLPCQRNADASATIDERSIVQPPRNGDQRRVLIAEDEPLVRRSLLRVLQQAGYQVMLADDGAEAVALFTKYGTEIAAILLDLNMPKMSGSEAVHRLKKMDPNVPILVLSGYAHDQREALRTAGVSAVLDKPCDTKRLLAALSGALQDRVAQARP